MKSSSREIREQLLALKEEKVSRQEGDPLRSYDLHKKQKEFVDEILVNGTREVWALWANRAGKSDAGAYVDAELLRHGWPDKLVRTSYNNVNGHSIEVRDRAVSMWVVSKDFPASRDIMQPKLFDNGFVPPGQRTPFIPEREIKEWRVSDQILKMKNGSLCGFKSCDSPVTKFYGAGKDVVHFDEEPPKAIFDECTIRVEAGRRLVVYSTCTLLPPQGEAGGVSWVFGDRVKPWKKGLLQDVKILTASIYDNPHLGPDEIKHLESIYPVGSTNRRIRLDGELLSGMGGSRAYGAFDSEIHVRECELDNRFPIAWIWDFNVAPMITHIGQYRGGVFYVPVQIHMESGSIPEMCDLFYDKFYDWPNDIFIYGDSTGQNRTGQTGMTDYAIISNHLRNHRINARLKIPTINPSISERLGAVNRALRNEQGEITHIIDPSCTELIADYEEVLMANNGGIKKSNNPSDPYYKRTHASDGVGYWIHMVAPVRMRRRGNNPFFKVKIPDAQYKL